MTKHIDRNGTKIAYEIVGDGPTSIVFVHGWLMHRGIYDQVREHLKLDGFRQIYLDMRGGGQSGQPESGYDLDTLVDDVIAVADDADAGTFVIVGHSLGGLVAQAVAAKVPDRVPAGVFITPVPLTGMAGVPMPEEAAQAMRGCGQNRDQISAVLDQTIVDIAPANKEHLINMAMQSSVACAEQTFDTFGRGTDGALYKDMPGKYLVLTADDPVLTPAFLQDKVTDRLANAKQMKIPGAGHYPLQEKPAEAAAILHGFLAELQAP